MREIRGGEGEGGGECNAFSLVTPEMRGRESNNNEKQCIIGCSCWREEGRKRNWKLLTVCAVKKTCSCCVLLLLTLSSFSLKNKGFFFKKKMFFVAHIARGGP